MKQKPTVPALKGLKIEAGSIPGPRRSDPALGRYGRNQPGYYLLRLRLRHSQKALRPLVKIP
jgi:hypothetical protein